MTQSRPGTMSHALTRNIAVMEARRREETAGARLQDRVADRVTAFTGSMVFVYLHLVLYGGWIAANLGLVPGIAKFDPSFVILAMEASVEAIFLSTFVLISQNRSAALAQKRADLDLHINLLTEHELTKLSRLVHAMAERLDVTIDPADEFEEIERDVKPEAVLDELGAVSEGQPD